MKNNMVSNSYKVRILPHYILMFWFSGIRFEGQPHVVEYGGGVLHTKSAGGDLPVSYRGFQVSCFGWRFHLSKARYYADASHMGDHGHAALPVAV